MTRTAAANALALPDAHQPVTGRRRFLAALASLPIIGAAGSSWFASRADAAAATIVKMIDAAQARCLATEKAFTDALAAYEATLPSMHPQLDFTKRIIRSGFHPPMERGFDGAHVTRGELHRLGGRFPRYIMTSAYCRDQIELHSDDVDIRRFFGRQRRRADKYEAALAQIEERLGLRRLDNERRTARVDLERLGDAIFAQPARSRGAIYAQARMICATQAVATREHTHWQLEGWGVTLAEGVRNLGRSA